MFFTTTGGECCPDWLIECQSFACRDALQDAILRSLHIEKQDQNCLTGGYWANPSFGSEISSIPRSGSINQILARFETASLEALRWLEANGVFTGLEVAASYNFDCGISLQIDFEQPTDCSFELQFAPGNFGWVWNGFTG